MTTMNKTKQNPVHNELFKMLTENTGRAMLDSGGAYGRNHERNAKKTLKDFIEEKPVDLEIPDAPCDISDLTYTISVFHYLAPQLELDDLCKEFNRRNKAAEDFDAETLTGTGEKVESWLNRNHSMKPQRCVNSYNHESNLSQVIQYTTLTIDGEPYIVLQIHGGCDVRGGYTTGRLFKLAGEMPYLEMETINVRLEKADGVEYRCSTSGDGHTIALEDDGIHYPDTQMEMKLEPLQMYRRQEVEVEFDPEMDVITAWLQEY